MSTPLNLSSTSPFILLFVLLLVSFPSLISSKCHTGDMNTLLKIKQHFGNASYFDSWDPAADCCFSWNNVICSGDNGGPVTGLFLSRANLSGTIPFNLLYKLRRLDFLVINFNPNLTGTLPPTITDFTAITQLTIASTGLSGPIPSSICNLTKVTLLSLSANRLTGPIPDCLRFKSGGLIDLGQNRLSGPVPASLGINTTYAYLNLDGNRLSGPIPRTFTGFDYNHLNLSGNRLTGDASFLFRENLEHAGELDISRNKLEFDLSNVTFPVSLNTLKLNRNKIYGSIPQQISKVMNLISFDVSYNRLCGPIPTVVGFMDPSSRPLFEHNKCLCGAPLKPCPSPSPPTLKV